MFTINILSHFLIIYIRCNYYVLPDYHPSIITIHPQVDTSQSYFTGNDECPYGYYCPIDTAYPRPCPLGAYSTDKGLIAAIECVLCPAGHWCNVTAFTSPGLAPLCDSG